MAEIDYADETIEQTFERISNEWGSQALLSAWVLTEFSDLEQGMSADDLGQLRKDLLTVRGEFAALRERVGELETALKNISDKVNAAATALNYPESPEEDSPTSEAYNHGFWDCAEMAIKEINAALTAEGNA